MPPANGFWHSSIPFWRAKLPTPSRSQDSGQNPGYAEFHLAPIQSSLWRLPPWNPQPAAAPKPKPPAAANQSHRLISENLASDETTILPASTQASPARSPIARNAAISEIGYHGIIRGSQLL